MYKIIIAPFPFLEEDKHKNRPLLVLREDFLTNTLIVVFMTSKINNQPLDTDILIKIDESTKLKTQLIVDTAIRFHKIGTIDKSLITNELGELPAKYHSEIQTKLKKLFNL